MIFAVINRATVPSLDARFDSLVHFSIIPFYLCSTDEHDAVQKKTFTKWINAQLSKVM